ncbi:MAG: DUF975 family protein [Lachnospiraceae bacterium]|nr:DUF975 family protein [Lachnospiraceae bacterium]
MDRASLKARGMAAFKANYWPAVGAGILMALAVGGSSGGSSASNSTQQAQDQMSNMDPGQAAMVVGAVLAIVAVVLIFASVYTIFVGGPLEIGAIAFFKDNLDAPAPFGTVLAGFKENYMKNVGTMFLRQVYLFLWGLLFFFPLLIKMYSYYAVPYIRREHPEMSANEVITASRQLMDGHKWELFVLDLSFLGWAILSALTLGILGVFYVNPYVFSTRAAFYDSIK